MALEIGSQEKLDHVVDLVFQKVSLQFYLRILRKFWYVTCTSLGQLKIQERQRCIQNNSFS